MAGAIDIINEVAAEFGVTPDELRGRTKRNVLADARTKVIRRLRNERGLSYTKIGLLMGGRSDDTIHYFVKERK